MFSGKSEDLSLQTFSYSACAAIVILDTIIDLFYLLTYNKSRKVHEPVNPYQSKKFLPKKFFTNSENISEYSRATFQEIADIVITLRN